MRLHGGEHRRKEGDRLRAMLAHIGVYRGAAGGDHGAHALFAQDGLILRFYEVRALRSFAHIRKAELLQCGTERGQAAAAEVCGIGGGDACNDFAPFPDQPADARDVVYVVLGVLRADDRAVAAEDAVPLHDHGAVVFHLDGFYRANADAFAAVLAVNAFKLQDAHRHCLLQPSLGRTY